MSSNGSRESWLKSNYGLSLEDYESMRKHQRDRCAVCGRKETVTDKYGKVKPLSVDHDHETGKVRALLCHSCNIGLGMFKDDIRTLAAAIVYLEDHGKPTPWED